MGKRRLPSYQRALLRRLCLKSAFKNEYLRSLDPSLQSTSLCSQLQFFLLSASNRKYFNFRLNFMPFQSVVFAIMLRGTSYPTRGLPFYKHIKLRCLNVRWYLLWVRSNYIFSNNVCTNFYILFVLVKVPFYNNITSKCLNV